MDIPVEHLRKALADAPPLPYIHVHMKGDDEETEEVHFLSPGHIGEPVFVVKDASEETVHMLLTVLNNFEHLLEVIDRPLDPDQFRPLTDAERERLQHKKMAEIQDAATAQMREQNDRAAKLSRRSGRWVILSTIAFTGTLVNGLYTLTMALNR